MTERLKALGMASMWDVMSFEFPIKYKFKFSPSLFDMATSRTFLIA